MKISREGHTGQIDASALPKGVYYMKISDKDKVYVSKVIIQ
ncbi:MAG: T9SS type A sorting domain-containing protein [Bacteroidetes bacterium]|nr:T9SS type A sorting domain-containing protein [Bacteroidota bacterium]